MRLKAGHRRQAGDDEVGNELGDLLGLLCAVRAVPVRRPVQRAQERAGGDGRVGSAQGARANALRDEGTDAAFVAIALGHDLRAQVRRQRVDFEMGSRSLDVVDQAQHVALGEIVQAIRQGPPVAPGGGERGDQPIERAVLAEEEELVLALKVVIEVAVREIGGDRDIAHAGARKAAGAEDLGGGAQDLDAPGIGAA